ncbi:MAG: DNA translocase FtsK [Spirochaetia bacterium]|nr:DNA translocase FtsK [Spirochaetia bacterium]
MKWLLKKEVSESEKLPWLKKTIENHQTNNINNQNDENFENYNEDENELNQIHQWETNTAENSENYIPETSFRESLQNLEHNTFVRNDTYSPEPKQENKENFKVPWDDIDKRIKESNSAIKNQINSLDILKNSWYQKKEALENQKDLFNKVQKTETEPNSESFSSHHKIHNPKLKWIDKKEDKFDNNPLWMQKIKFIDKEELFHIKENKLNENSWIQKEEIMNHEKPDWFLKKENSETENIIPANEIYQIKNPFINETENKPELENTETKTNEFKFEKINSIPCRLDIYPKEKDNFETISDEPGTIEFSENIKDSFNPIQSEGPLKEASLQDTTECELESDSIKNETITDNSNEPSIEHENNSYSKPDANKDISIDEYFNLNKIEEPETKDDEKLDPHSVAKEQVEDLSISEEEEEEKCKPEFSYQRYREEKNKSEEELKNKETQKSDPLHEEPASVTPILSLGSQYNLPFHILRKQETAVEINNTEETQYVIKKLESTLEQFNIEGRVVGIQAGPIITRYEVKMAPGIKVSKILGLTDELAMALEAIRVRIEAPIPGRSTVGIEIPNKKRKTVYLGDIVSDNIYNDFNGALPLPLGKDIAGNPVVHDLTKMPHLLIAGATGSGKSVAVNSFISSLILNKSPNEVRFLLIDPKLVELSHYNDIPHLLHPVIIDQQKAIQALNWAVEEMERRYEDLADLRVRDIRTYNERIKEHKKENPSHTNCRPIMPYIVILIDELGDLMLTAGKEIESSVIRLSQKARAVGIHLILATQRPSVDVITALIKANCPARIALQVAQKTDSRTILDSNGAEQLVGAGDLLFKHPSCAQLMRIQAPLVNDEEVEEIVKNTIPLGKPSYITLEDPKANSGTLDSEDEELFDEAWNIILESQKASASYLQRRLRIGYNRAARIIEALEAKGYIGPQIGSKPRDILLQS